jgi:uncharacterized glyoxalase superfamily protein PhnB
MDPIDNHPTIIPIFRYRDRASAIEWLCKAFGFKQQLVVPDNSGDIAHTQLVYGNGMIRLNNEFHAFVKSPAQSGSIGSEGAFVLVNDVDAHYAQAIGAGAEIVIDLSDDEYGGRSYSCRDLEGHIWNFSNYDPWSSK